MIPLDRTVMLGVPLARIGMDETVDWIDRAIASGEPHQVATANVNFLALGRRDPVFLRILQDASLVTADGMPLCWASRLQGARLPERVTGADLVPRLCALAAARGYRVFLMGPPVSTDEAARRLCARHPGLQIVGTEVPPHAPIESWDNAAYCARIRAARADLLLVGFGAPKQERWIARYLPETGAAVAIGVGATFDYIAERVRRAPVWVQSAGLEWAWRLAAEPRRLWRRYLFDGGVVGPWLAGQLLTSAWVEWQARRDPVGRVRVRRATGDPGTAIVSLTGQWRADRLPVLRRALHALHPSPHGLVIDLWGAGFVAPAVLGELVAVVGWMRAAGGTTVLVVESPRVRRLLETAGLAGLAPRVPSVAEGVGRLVRGRDPRLVYAA